MYLGQRRSRWGRLACLGAWLSVVCVSLAVAAPPLPPLAPEPSARLAAPTVRAATEGEVLLTVDAAGRFAIRAESQTGVALQLVDMIAGPGDIAGEAGKRDGRLDVLLDQGVYKLRSFGAPGADGEAALVVTPFRHAAPASDELWHGGTVSSVLADMQQRAYWIVVDASGQVTVEAVGRALQDLRLWQHGVDLAALTPTLTSLEPRPGRPMTQARLEGRVEPGLYLLTAYGGVALPWSHEDSAQPLHIRVGGVAQLVGGWAEGTIGPLGSMRFAVPPPDTLMRLELPDPAPVRLLGGRQGGAQQAASVLKSSREPVAAVTLPLAGRNPALLEVVGFEGQPFRLRTLQPASTLRVEAKGPHLVTVDVAGDGGDDVPATAVLARFERGRGTVLAAHTPRVGPGQAWRRQFNLRGATTLLVEITGAGPVAAQTSGPGVRLALAPLLGSTAPRVDGRVPAHWDVEPGWYTLTIDPIGKAAGILDLTFGQPGLAVESPEATPPQTALTFGIYDLAPSTALHVFTNVAPGLVTGPKVRALPVDLATASLGLWQRAASGLDLPVRLPTAGTLQVVEASGAAVPFTTSNATTDTTGRTLTVHLPAPERDRSLAVLWSPERVPAAWTVPAPVVPDMLHAGQPRFFDLAEEATRRLVLEVPAGGLYRVETLGRLRTALRLSTPFAPALAGALDNGPGHNALLQTYLRAGVYRVTVSAHASAGHLGLVATPASLQDTVPLTAGSSVRASLVAGRGALIPLEIHAAGVYRLDLYGLERTHTARLEDAEGWPLHPPGEMTQVEQPLAPGRYRLVVLPAAVETRVVARLTAVEPPAPLVGHGPHVLPFDQPQAFQWREPETKDAPRTPDRWTFALSGTSRVVLEISDGMVAELLREDSPTPPLAKIVDKRGFAGPLAAGRYVVEARSLGRNDRLEYRLTLRATEMQPGSVRILPLPATVPLTLAQDRVVSLTTFGNTELAGLLKDADGRIVERLVGRSDDWNIALSRRLAAGSYTLVLVPAGTDDEAVETTDDEDTAPRRTTVRRTKATDIEVHFALPEVVEAGALTFGVPQHLAGPHVQHLSLPAPETGSLLLVTAQSRAELVLALERQDAATGWSTVGVARGTAPVLAVPADDVAPRPWRVAVWAVDGGATPWTLTALTHQAAPQTLGAVRLTPLREAGIATPLALAQVHIPGATILTLHGAPEVLDVGATPGRPLSRHTGGLIVPQTERLWLLGRQETTVTLTPTPLSGPLALSLHDGETARIPAAPVAPGYWRFWHAESTFGQPGLDAGQGMGVTPGSAFGQDHGAMLRVWHATGEAALRLRVRAMEAQIQPSQALTARYAGLLPAHSAQPLALAPGVQQLDLSLAAGLGAVLSGGTQPPVTVWTGEHATTRTLVGEWHTLVLVNTGTSAAPVAVDVLPGTGGRLQAGQVFKRFFGAAGAYSLHVEAIAGDRLLVAGAQATFLTPGGQVQRGTALPLSGAGTLVLDYDPGLVAAWIERAGVSPWPSAPLQRVTLPQQLALSGPAMALAVEPVEPVLVRLRTTAPVILTLAQGDTAAPAQVFPAGAALSRYLDAGSASLHLYAPHDGVLTGALELSATPIEPIGEGLGSARVLAPGGTLLFGFEVTRDSEIGVGVRAAPDRAAVRLLDATGRVLGEGLVQLRRLTPGRYVLEVQAPPQGTPLTVRPALVGLLPPPAGTPPDVAATYLDLVGLTPSGAR